MATPVSPFAHLLADPRQVLDDLQKVEAELHSATASPPPAAPTGTGAAGSNGSARRLGGLTFGGHVVDAGAAPASAPQLTLASRVVEQQAVVKQYNDASESDREQMWKHPSLQLFSIIFENYRPGPAFLVDHTLPPAVMNGQRMGPGGPTWAQVTAGQPLSRWALSTVRLDNQAGTQRGSGTLLPEGSILTAGHVIHEPGWLFGEPPVQGTPATADFNRVLGGSPLLMALSQFLVPGALDFAWITAATGAHASALALQTTPLTEAELKGRPVAVIGHPGPPPAADRLLAYKIYNDGPMGFKRFMPGQLHPDTPLVTDDQGLTYLRHDCSTLGGASGACLVDLTTGRILGVHISGISEALEEDRNRAVPAWLITAPGALSPV